MNYLILLNRKFPYLSGETFIENEINLIASSFDKILIYPLNASIDDEMTRTIDADNVYPIVFEKHNWSKRRYRYILNIPKHIFNSNENNIATRIMDAYFNAVSYSYSKKIIKDLDKRNFNSDDTVYLYSYWLYFNAKIACILKEYFKSRNINVVAFSRAHRFDIKGEERPYGFLPQVPEMMNELDGIFPCSDDGSNYLRHKYPNNSNKVKTSYLGTLEHGTCPDKTDDTFNLLSCSRVTNVKRVDMIAKALSLLQDKNYKIKWTHFGDGALFDDLKKYVQQLNNIEVDLKGYMPNNKILEHYDKNHFDLFINVSTSEGLPVSIMEAISYAIPCIATDVGGTNEIVVDGVSGKLIDKDISIENLALELEKFINMDDKQLKNLSLSARKLWEERFIAKKNYREFVEDIYKLNNHEK